MGCTHIPGLEAAWASVGLADHLVRDARGQHTQLQGEQRDRSDRLHELRLSWGSSETCEGGTGS